MVVAVADAPHAPTARPSAARRPTVQLLLFDPAPDRLAGDDASRACCPAPERLPVGLGQAVDGLEEHRAPASAARPRAAAPRTAPTSVGCCRCRSRRNSLGHLVAARRDCAANPAPRGRATLQLTLTSITTKGHGDGQEWCGPRTRGTIASPRPGAGSTSAASTRCAGRIRAGDRDADRLAVERLALELDALQNLFYADRRLAARRCGAWTPAARTARCARYSAR